MLLLREAAGRSMAIFAHKFLPIYTALDIFLCQLGKNSAALRTAASSSLQEPSWVIHSVSWSDDYRRFFP
jgi:hypothetical protein